MDSSSSVLLIAGPTGSGKSALALELACHYDGEIINADAIQVYRDLRILSARPPPDDEKAVPHHLYGFVAAREHYSAGVWLAEAQKLIHAVHRRGRLPILVGGSGLYMRALTSGLAEMPRVPAARRAQLAADLARDGLPALYQRLEELDPLLARRLRPSDTQRILRGLEVVLATGQPLSRWIEQNPARPPADMTFLAFALTPEKTALAANIAKRLASMLKQGVVEEARRLLGQNLPPSLPVMKAIGLGAIRRHLAGELDFASMAAEIETATRRNAKRQMTWIRTQMPDWTRLPRPSLAEVKSLIPLDLKG